MTSEVTLLKGYIQTLQQENSAKLNEIQLMDQQITHLSHQNTQLNEELNKLVLNSSQSPQPPIHPSLAEHEHTVNQLENSLKAREKEVRKLRRELDRNKQQIEEMNEVIMMNEMNNIRDTEEQQLTNEDRYSTEVQGHNQLIETYQTKQKQNFHLIDSLTHAFQDKERELLEAKIQEAQRTKLLETYLLQIQDLEEKITEASIEVDVLKLTNEALEASSCRLNLDNIQLTQELSQLNEKIFAMDQNSSLTKPESHNVVSQKEESHHPETPAIKDLEKQVQQLHIMKNYHDLKETEWDRECLEFDATIGRLKKELSILKGDFGMKSISEERLDESMFSADEEIIENLKEQVQELLQSNQHVLAYLNKKQLVDYTPEKASERTTDAMSPDQVPSFNDIFSSMSVASKSKYHTSSSTTVSLSTPRSNAKSASVSRPLESLQSGISELKGQSNILRRLFSFEPHND